MAAFVVSNDEAKETRCAMREHVASTSAMVEGA